jgi:proline iminopeptidase
MFVEVNGARLRVDVQGEGNAVPIYTHHGAPGLGSHAEPKRAFGPLSDEYRVIAFDARGSGASDAIPPYSHEQWVADLDALREHFGDEKIVLAGGSYGGYIALEYTLAHPDRVSHLILRDTSASRRFEGMAKANALARAKEYPDITEEMLDKLFNGQIDSNDQLREYWATIAPLYDANTTPEKIAQRIASATFRYETHNWAFSKNIPNFDISSRLHEIKCPVLIVVGRHDWITPVAASEEIKAGIPHARLEIFENSGHSPQLEESEKFLAMVREFLAS